MKKPTKQIGGASLIGPLVESSPKPTKRASENPIIAALREARLTKAAPVKTILTRSRK